MLSAKCAGIVTGDIPVIAATGRWWQEEHEFKASWGCTVKYSEK